MKFLIVFSLFLSCSSFAGYAPNCHKPRNQTEVDWCDYHEGKTTPFSEEIHNLQGSFCALEKGHLFGWRFSKILASSDLSRFNVARIDSLGGMPNPFTEFLFYRLGTSNDFYVREAQALNGETLKEYGPYEWVSSNAFTDGVSTYIRGQCRLN
jgi:hypothetical protein